MSETPSSFTGAAAAAPSNPREGAKSKMWHRRFLPRKATGAILVKTAEPVAVSTRHSSSTDGGTPEIEGVCPLEQSTPTPSPDVNFDKTIVKQPGVIDRCLNVPRRVARFFGFGGEARGVNSDRRRSSAGDKMKSGELEEKADSSHPEPVRARSIDDGVTGGQKPPEQTSMTPGEATEDLVAAGAPLRIRQTTAEATLSIPAFQAKANKAEPTEEEQEEFFNELEKKIASFGSCESPISLETIREDPEKTSDPEDQNTYFRYPPGIQNDHKPPREEHHEKAVATILELHRSPEAPLEELLLPLNRHPDDHDEGYVTNPPLPLHAPIPAARTSIAPDPESSELDPDRPRGNSISEARIQICMDESLVVRRESLGKITPEGVKSGGSDVIERRPILPPRTTRAERRE